MPKQRITKEMVIEAAFELLKNGGEEQVLVKNIAEKLSCSVQPIYSYCENMDILRQQLSAMAEDFMRGYVARRLDKNALFESTGKAYISFAKEEPHLFKNYFLRKREGIANFSDLYAAEAGKDMASYLAKTLNISEKSAKELHMNMIIYSTGISFMLVSTGGNFQEQEINERLMTAYNVFLQSAKKEGENL